QYKAGVAARADVITAQTQLTNARASAADVGVQRAQNEHAIAVLAGLTPAELTIPVQPALDRTVPTPPILTPTVLLQRRPDIAAAERQV
ncbi:RND transporter, partial [Acinetobacter baumannii]